MGMTSYHNFFYNPNNSGSSPTIETEATPTEYKGFKIYKRFDVCFDIVYNGVCIGMYGSIDKAMTAVDDNGVIYVSRAKRFLKALKK